MFERKYNAVIERSFKSKVDVFLFNELSTTGEIKAVDEVAFIKFSIAKQIADQYEDSWQRNDINGIPVKDFDKKIESWYKGNLDLIKKLFTAYENHFKLNFTMNEFMEFYREKEEERQCFYCKTTEAEILKLRGSGLIKTKRNRGKQMEIDRKNSNMEYSKDNVVLACYWCNNAKTDEFTKEEFEAIGNEIRKIWNNRLAKINV